MPHFAAANQNAAHQNNTFGCSLPEFRMPHLAAARQNAAAHQKAASHQNAAAHQKAASHQNGGVWRVQNSNKYILIDLLEMQKI